MLHTLKLFWRSIKRNQLFSFINILGLTVGFFSSILIYIYVENEWDYDQFHELGEQTYRINQTFIWGDDNPNLFSSTGPGVGYAALEDIPEVVQMTRIHTPDLMPVRFQHDGKEHFFKDETLFAADSNFFDVFSFPLRYGDRHTALDEPRSVVLTKETSIQFFGDENPVGKLIDLSGGPQRTSYKITGVIDEQEENSYVGDFDMLVSMSSIDRVARSNWNWMWTMFETYVVLDEAAEVHEVAQKVNELPEKHAVKTLDIMGYTYEEYQASGKEWNLYLQPLRDIYLHSTNIYNRLSGVGNYKMVVALIGSAVFLVILSCINFINLSTAQFTARAKDVALRKVLGGSKAAFQKRFFGESLAYCLISFVLSMFLIVYALPLINQSLELNLSLQQIEVSLFVLFFVVLILVVSVISGLYPFAFFNRFQPVSAMKGEFRTGKKGVAIRNGMLTAQYVLSFLLIICTLTIYQQLTYFLNADVGFEKEQLLVVENALYTGSTEEFAVALEKLEGISDVAICDASPLLISNGDQFLPDEPNAGSIPLNFALGDENYLDMLGVELAVGRSFDDAYADDVNGIVINETAARSIGWQIDERILEKKLTNWSGTYHIIGVVKDFNFWSLHAPIEP